MIFFLNVYCTVTVRSKMVNVKFSMFAKQLRVEHAYSTARSYLVFPSDKVPSNKSENATVELMHLPIAHLTQPCDL